MAKKRRPKKPRGASGERMAQPDGSPSEKSGVACDLMVTIGKDSTTHLEKQLQIREVLTRFSSTGYTHAALVHIIYGRPRNVEDQSARAMPTSLWLPHEEESSSSEPAAKKQKKSQTVSLTRMKKDLNIKVLRRIHAVLENLSDVGSYISNGPDATLLNQYDLISVAPRNDAVFQSVCASATNVDIITLDYSSTRGMKLPFKIRASDVKAAMERGVAFEIHYAPAILQTKFRKALVQTCRELQSATPGKKPLIVFSSGDRTFEDSDVGPMALRLPGDLSNLMHVLLQFDPATSSRAVGAAALEVIQRAEARRFGKSDIVEVSIGRPMEVPTSGEVQVADTTSKLLKSAGMEAKTQKGDDSSGDEGGVIEDGFISMT